jgi:hypothetical protein
MAETILAAMRQGIADTTADTTLLDDPS